MITWSEYVQFTDTTAAYPGADVRGKTPQYVAHGLISEFGELHGVFKRRLRDDCEKWTMARLAELRGELGDILWYCARYAVHWDDVDWDDVDCDDDLFDANGHRSAYNHGDEAWWEEFGMSVLAGDAYSTVVAVRDLAMAFSWTLAEIAAENMVKLRDRKARGVIHGKGGDR